MARTGRAAVEDMLEYWERDSANHNEADPWLEQRYVPHPIPEDAFERRMENRDVARVFAVRDEKLETLRDVDLIGASFEGERIKGCNLSKFSLRRLRVRGANFTRTRFLASDLSGADLSGCDLEGADSRGPDLRGASLTVARFAHAQNPAILLDPADGAVIE